MTDIAMASGLWSQDNKTDYHLPSWDLDFRGHNQHARKYIIPFLFLSLIFANSIQLNFISKATSLLNWKGISLLNVIMRYWLLIFPHSVNICWLCLHSIYPSFSCSKTTNFLWGTILCLMLSCCGSGRAPRRLQKRSRAQWMLPSSVEGL